MSSAGAVPLNMALVKSSEAGKMLSSSAYLPRLMVNAQILFPRANLKYPALVLIFLINSPISLSNYEKGFGSTRGPEPD
jgi:hypothetical protein